MNHFQVAKEEMSFYGAEYTSLQNILAVLIGPKAIPAVTGQLASYGPNKLAEMSLEELKSFEGIGETAANRIISSFGLAIQFTKVKKEERLTVRSPEDAYKILQPELAILNQEHFVVLFLNTKNQVIHKKTIFIGSLNASVVHPREIFREAVKRSAASIICSHNHPSGNSTPSPEDINVTERIAEAGNIVGIDLLDHVIIGANSYTSMKEKGYF